MIFYQLQRYKICSRFPCGKRIISPIRITSAASVPLQQENPRRGNGEKPRSRPPLPCRGADSTLPPAANGAGTFPKKSLHFPEKALPLSGETSAAFLPDALPLLPEAAGRLFPPPQQSETCPEKAGKKVGSRLYLVKHCHTLGGEGVKFSTFAAKVVECKPLSESPAPVQLPQGRRETAGRKQFLIKKYLSETIYPQFV